MSSENKCGSATEYPKEAIEWLRNHRMRKRRGKGIWEVTYKGDDEMGAPLFTCQVRADWFKDNLAFHAILYVSRPSTATSIDHGFYPEIQDPMYRLGFQMPLCFSEGFNLPVNAVRSAIRKTRALFDALCGTKNVLEQLPASRFYSLENFFASLDE